MTGRTDQKRDRCAREAVRSDPPGSRRQAPHPSIGGAMGGHASPIRWRRGYPNTQARSSSNHAAYATCICANVPWLLLRERSRCAVVVGGFGAFALTQARHNHHVEFKISREIRRVAWEESGPGAFAVAAISASGTGTAGFLPQLRSAPATRPNARAVPASKGSGSKSDSVFCRSAWRAARNSFVPGSAQKKEARSRVAVAYSGISPMALSHAWPLPHATTPGLGRCRKSVTPPYPQDPAEGPWLLRMRVEALGIGLLVSPAETLSRYECAQLVSLGPRFT
jgi:hypothetical protein